MLDLRHLTHLVALDDERHFARAAARVHLSQPAFSRSIQALEQALEQRLFDRAAGDVRPTAAGEFLIDRARKLLFDARCLQRDAELYAQSQLGDVAFGAGPFPVATLMPDVMRALRSGHPGLQFSVEIGHWQQLLGKLQGEVIDFFVAETRGLPLDATLDLLPLGRQKGGFYVRKGHPLAGRPCTLSACWSYGVACTRVPPVINVALAQALGLGPGQQAPLALQCDDFSVLRTTALQTDTVLGATDVAVAADLKTGRLIPLRIKALPPLHVEMGVVSLRKRSPSPSARRLIQVIQNVAKRVNVWD